MKSGMFISVVIPLYNKADVIVRTLDSVRNQTFRDFEVVIVDDGSTDGSAILVEEYSDKYRSELIIRLIRKVNGGVSSARNEGIRQARGKFVAFLDADDVWLPDHLSAVVSIVGRHSDAKAIASGYRWCVGEQGIELCGGKNPYCINLFRHSAFALPVHTSAFVAERELLLTDGGFDERHSFFEDYLLFFKLATKYPFHFTGKVTELHMADAKENLTDHAGRYGAADFPHYQYVSMLIESATADENIVFYASNRALECISQAVRCGDVAGAREFVAKCPGMIRMSRLARMLVWLNERGRIGRLVGRLGAVSAAVYLKLRRRSIMRKA